jgi:hypothetical protein
MSRGAIGVIGTEGAIIGRGAGAGIGGFATRGAAGGVGSWARAMPANAIVATTALSVIRFIALLLIL